MVSNSIRLPRLSGMQRIVVLLLAVTGIVVGLLAMHTLTTVAGDHTTHHATAAATHDHAAVASTATAAVHPAAIADNAMTGMPGPTSDCNGTCDSGHNMANMVCLLALLVLTLVVTLRVIFTRWGNDLHRLVAALTAALPAVLAPPSPPSLHILSISRT
ncbi:DUF6153 family protein [Leifsonia sp. F6_8S_P_1B]|uniref:DUF6153 family protein n=1 Tax=Leifsonia williamsii TaxID=3035919 RepID=A0ABT8K848_9MICO|nr:DUF6153 family protein [Leifsonia williamsii]MDN4613168.1 DUF6153 family protein [Leifsonia williamsii]